MRPQVPVAVILKRKSRNKRNHAKSKKQAHSCERVGVNSGGGGAGFRKVCVTMRWLSSVLWIASCWVFGIRLLGRFGLVWGVAHNLIASLFQEFFFHLFLFGIDKNGNRFTTFLIVYVDLKEGRS